jgi:hypothetical protein
MRSFRAALPPRIPYSGGTVRFPSEPKSIYSDDDAFVEWQNIVAEAKKLRERAAAIGMSDELVSILSPPAKRKRGRQKGSRSPALAARREALWLAYKSEKAASPNTSDEKITEVLHRRGYGKSSDAILSRIRGLKRTIAGEPRKPGRPKKIRR